MDLYRARRVGDQRVSLQNVGQAPKPGRQCLGSRTPLRSTETQGDSHNRVDRRRHDAGHATDASRGAANPGFMGNSTSRSRAPEII